MGKLENTRELVRWLGEEGGYVHPNAEIRDDPKSGLGLYATAAIEKDERLISCPFKLAVTKELASRAIASVCGLEEEKLVWPGQNEAWNERMLAAAYIGLHWVWEDNVAKDEQWPAALIHRPYVAALPPAKELTTPLYFSEAERELLVGTNLAGAVADRERDWQAESTAVREVLKEDGLTWERYLAVATFLSSRAFPSSLLRLPDGETTTAGKEAASESYPVLLPGLDMLNHSRGQPILWLSSHIPSASGDVEAISFVAAQPQTIDSEVFNNYGAKSNESLLLAYGFVIPDNPDDTVVLRLGGTPPATAEKLTAQGLDAGEQFLLGRDCELPKRLMEVVRVMFGGHDHSHSHDHEEEGEEDEHAAHQAEEDEFRLELEVLDALGSMLESKLNTLRQGKSFEEAGKVREEVFRMCTVYRQGQVDILEQALEKLEERMERIEGLMDESPGCPCGC